MSKVMVAMSGGVDSSVSSALLIQRGFDCIGVMMKLRDAEEGSCTEKSCCTANDAEDARNVAYSLGMKFYVFNFVNDFEENVISRFINEYVRGLTPNPCIDCNRYMKFDLLYERGKTLGYDYIATGHYARTEYVEETGRWVLKKARNLSKDQSYVLYSMTQEQLSHTFFPLGDFEGKDEVRALAEELGFHNAQKHDSQDICFVPDGDYARFIEIKTGKKSEPGDVVDTNGNVVGRHSGLIHYTVGQRKGLGIAFGKPTYILGKNTADNTLLVGSETELKSDTLRAGSLNWISISDLDGPIICKAKIRYHMEEQPCVVYPEADGTVTVEFNEPQRAITPGQRVVFYDGDIVIGGGVIF